MKLGDHYLLELTGVRADMLNNPVELEKLCLKFCSIAKVQVLHTHFHQFSPQGVTGLILISESHLSIHTWPEHQYCAIDFFTCRVDAKNQDPTEFFEKALQPTDCKSMVVHRTVAKPQEKKRA